jgi:hypothetical protein
MYVVSTELANLYKLGGDNYALTWHLNYLGPALIGVMYCSLAIQLERYCLPALALISLILSLWIVSPTSDAPRDYRQLVYFLFLGLNVVAAWLCFLSIPRNDRLPIGRSIVGIFGALVCYEMWDLVTYPFCTIFDAATASYIRENWPMLAATDETSSTCGAAFGRWFNWLPWVLMGSVLVYYLTLVRHYTGRGDGTE